MTVQSGPFGGVKFLPTLGTNRDNLSKYLTEQIIHPMGGSWPFAQADINGGNLDKTTELCIKASETSSAVQISTSYQLMKRSEMGGLTMAKQKTAIFIEERKQDIVEMVNRIGKVTCAELCKKFQVSQATIRNDLNNLGKLGLLTRTHGGAIIAHGIRAGYEQTTTEKESRNMARKQAIARKALQFVNSGDVIALDSGTTTMELAKLLNNIKGITVITNDVKIALYLNQNSSAEVVLLGGVVRHDFHCTTGKLALEGLDNLYIDTVFLAANGLSLTRGFSTPRMEQAEVKRKMVQSARRIVALADGSKTSNEAFVAFAGVKEVDTLITDASIGEEFVAKAEEIGMRVIVADPAGVAEQ